MAAHRTGVHGGDCGFFDEVLKNSTVVVYLFSVGVAEILPMLDHISKLVEVDRVVVVLIEHFEQGNDLRMRRVDAQPGGVRVGRCEWVGGLVGRWW